MTVITSCDAVQYMSRAEKSARLVARANTFCAMVPNIFSVIIAVFPLNLCIKFVPVHMQPAESRSHHNCGSSVCTLPDVTFLALRIWGWLLGFVIFVRVLFMYYQSVVKSTLIQPTSLRGYWTFVALNCDIWRLSCECGSTWYTYFVYQRLSVVIEEKNRSGPCGIPLKYITPYTLC
jgi:hypothetical protein